MNFLSNIFSYSQIDQVLSPWEDDLIAFCPARIALIRLGSRSPFDKISDRISELESQDPQGAMANEIYQLKMRLQTTKARHSHLLWVTSFIKRNKRRRHAG